MTRISNRTLTAVLALVTAFGLTAGCRRTERASAPAAPKAAPGALRGRARRPLLVRRRSAHPALGRALETIARCDAQGLDPADYDAGKLAASWESLKAGASAADRALFDVAVTVSAMRLLQSVHWGRVDPRLVGFDYDVTTRRLDLATDLRAARDGAGLATAVAAAEPPLPVYRRLVAALADYKVIAAAEPPAVPALPAGLKKVEPGKPWAGVTALAERLASFGDLPKDAPAPGTAPDGTPLYEGALVAAVERFQERHALEPDKTPIFVDQMEYVVFRPYWSPPPSIVRSEIVPKARRDPSCLDRQNMEIVASGDERAPALPATPENLDAVVAGRLFVRQKPGEKNSLGLAKFIFPNSENVHMHGTPAQSLFARARRDFSHGCIRLEDPARLALWVLRRQPEWTRERIEAAMQASRPTQVNLKEKLTVFLFYDTAYVDSKGVVQFADDYYGHDAQLEKALRHGYPYPRKS